MNNENKVLKGVYPKMEGNENDSELIGYIIVVDCNSCSGEKNCYMIKL